MSSDSSNPRKPGANPNKKSSTSSSKSGSDNGRGGREGFVRKVFKPDNDRRRPQSPEPMKRADAASTMEAQALKRANLEELVSKIFGGVQDDQGKISGKKILSALKNNMTVTPAMRSGQRSQVPHTGMAAAATKGKSREIYESSSDSESEVDDSDVVIKIFNEKKIQDTSPVFWITYDFPFDPSRVLGMVRWPGSENHQALSATGYDAAEAECLRQRYLVKVLGNVRAIQQGKHPKGTLTVYLRFHQAVEGLHGDRVGEDLEKAVRSLIRIIKLSRLRFICQFDSESDGRLDNEDYRSMAVNWTGVIFSMVNEEIFGPEAPKEVQTSMMSGKFSDDNGSITWRDYGAHDEYDRGLLKTTFSNERPRKRASTACQDIARLAQEQGVDEDDVIAPARVAEDAERERDGEWMRATSKVRSETERKGKPKS